MKPEKQPKEDEVLAAPFNVKPTVDMPKLGAHPPNHKNEKKRKSQISKRRILMGAVYFFIILLFVYIFLIDRKLSKVKRQIGPSRKSGPAS